MSDSDFVSCDVSELKAFPGTIKDWNAATGREVDRAVGRQTDALYARARGSVAHDSGALYDSIGHDTSGKFSDGYARRVWADDDAAIEEEYGTATQAPHPFLMVYADDAGLALFHELVDELPVAP